MNRRQMLLGCTVLISLCYAAAFYFLFAYDTPSEMKPVLLQNDKSDQMNTLYWLQAGVFKEASSYEGLIEKMNDGDISVVCVTANDLTYIVVSPTFDHLVIDKVLETMDEMNIEVIEKHAELNQQQIELFENGQLEELLKDVISS